MKEFSFKGFIESPFRIDSIVPAINPNGGPEVWHQYVISQGPGAGNAICGQQCGTRAEVLQRLLTMVEQLNARFGH